MKKLNSIVLLSSLLTSTCFANSVLDYNAVTFEKAYNKAKNNALIHCEYKYFIDVPEVQVVDQTFVPGQYASAQFKIKDSLLTLTAREGGTKGVVDFDLDGTKFQTSMMGLDGIQINLSNLSANQQKLANEFSLNSLNCSLELGRESQHVIHDPEVHINVHPHPKYDYDGESFPGTQRELDVAGRETLVLLDDSVGNLKQARSGNFNNLMNGQAPNMQYNSYNYDVPSFTFPNQAEFKLSQAGHNKYIIKNPQQKIVFTGGNHNFCILNNTRRLLHAFFENPDRQSIRFDYITDSIVVQRGGTFIKNGNIPRGVFKQSNQLKNMFKIMTLKQRQNYIQGFFKYFSYSYLNEKQYYFRQANISITGVEGAEYSETVEGKGSGVINIELVFI